MPAPRVAELLLNGNRIPSVRNYSQPIPSLPEMLLSQAGEIFPGYYVSRFELALYRDLEETAVVDLALVSQDYSAWHLLFVAPIRTADLEYLRAKLRIALDSPFGNREATELIRQIKKSDEGAGLDEDKTKTLVDEGPKFAIVTDDPRHGWDKEFTGLEVDIVIVEPFRVGDGFVFRVNGDYPARLESDVFGTCSTHPVVPGTLVVDWTIPDEAPAPGPFQMQYEGVTTSWDLVQGSSQWVLMPESEASGLHEEGSFEIVKASDETYLLRKQIREV